MAELKMEVILKAFDHVTATLRGIDGSIGKTKQKLTDYKKHVKELHKGIPLSGPLTKQQQRDQQEIERTNKMIERQQQRLKDLYKMQAHRNSGKAMMGAGSMQIAAATAMGYGASRFLSVGADFEETMSRVQALTLLKKDDALMKALNQNARDLGKTTWASATQVAGGQAFYAQAGFKPTEIIQAMESTLNLARAGRLEIDRAADINSNILTAFGLTASDSEKVANSLSAAFTRTNVDMEMLGQSMKYMAPSAKSLGMSIDESLAMVGLLGNVGIQADQAGTSMRKIQLRLAAPPSGARKALDELKIKTTDSQGNLRKIADIFQEMFTKTKSMGNADKMRLLSAISGIEASSAMATFVESDFYKNYGTLFDDISSAYSRNELQVAASVMADNLKGDLKDLNSAWEEFRIAVFFTNNKGLRGTFQWLTKIMRKVGDFASNNPEIIRNLSYITAGIIGITSALGLAKLAWGAFQFAVLGNPVAASLAVIGLSIYAIYKNLDKWRWFWNEGFFQMQTDIDQLLRKIPIFGTSLANTWLAITNGSKVVVDTLGFLVDLVFDFDNAWLKVIDTWDDLSANAKRFWNDMVAWAQPAVDKIMKILQPFLDAYYAIVGKKDPTMYDNLDIFNKTGLSFDEFNNLSEDAQMAVINPRREGTDAEREEVIRMMTGGANRQVSNTQTNTFQIHITAPGGTAPNIADAVKRGIASVSPQLSAFLGDTK